MSPWKCSNCNAEVGRQFDLCWQCGTSSEGVADPSFVRQVDVGTLPTGWVARIKCQSCGYFGKVLISHYGYRWWTVLVAIALSCLVGGLIPWIFFFLFLGNFTCNACPACGSRKGLLDWDGADMVPPPEAEDIWNASQAADHAAFRENKLMMLTIVTVIFLATMVWLYFPK